MDAFAKHTRTDIQQTEGLTTKQLAAALGVKVNSLLVNKAQNGGVYRGLTPVMMNGRLIWPMNSLARIAAREAYLADHWRIDSRNLSVQEKQALKDKWRSRPRRKKNV